MFPWVDWTWNPISGKCPYACRYCYMRKYWPRMPRPRFRAYALDDMPLGDVVFVGSSIDMWADAIPAEWIRQVLEHCAKYPETTFYFESKNPRRYAEFKAELARIKNVLLGTTIETNREYEGTGAPSPEERAIPGLDVVSIEPIMEFDLEEMVRLIRRVKPQFVSIGADSKSSGLEEPEPWKIKQLIGYLSRFTEVRYKKNLARLIHSEMLRARPLV